MWEGLDRFSKTYELNGNLAIQQSHFNQNVEKFMAESKDTFEKIHEEQLRMDALQSQTSSA